MQNAQLSKGLYWQRRFNFRFMLDGVLGYEIGFMDLVALVLLSSECCIVWFARFQ